MIKITIDSQSGELRVSSEALRILKKSELRLKQERKI